MRETEYKVKRMTLTKEEQIISKSWGSLWTRFGVLERSGRPIVLIFGDWSGYRSSQYQITHVDYAGYYGNPGQSSTDDFSGTIKFTDNTTMSVWCRVVTRAEIIEKQFKRRQNYNKLINDMIKSGKTFYDLNDPKN